VNWKKLSDMLFPDKSGLDEMTDSYPEAIKFLQDEIKEQREIIEGYKKKHPKNGTELNQWLAREEENFRRIVELLKQNRALRQEILSLKKSKKKKK
jgi:hypothetical protein